MPFHFPGSSGLTVTLCCAVPYRAGAHGFNICSGLPPRTAGGTTPPGSRAGSGGGGFCDRAAFRGATGAVYVWAKTALAIHVIPTIAIHFFITIPSLADLSRALSCSDSFICRCAAL